MANAESTQDGRVLALFTPLGKDVLLIDSLSMSEGISRLFVMDIQVRVELTKVSMVKGEDLLGKAVAISLELPNQGVRLFHGLVSRFSEGGQDGRFRYYYMQVVPWLWLLTLTSNCRVFQKQSVPDIIQKIFQDRHFTYDVRAALRPGDYTQRDYCVQYRETDFNFISRLMEEEGIFYFFEVVVEGDTVRHRLVIADSLTKTNPCPGQGPANYLSTGPLGGRVNSWQMTHSLRPGQVSLRDYHFQVSDVIQEVIEVGYANLAVNANLEVYDYPGDFAGQQA
jgi:type VI secretion system secreted protein VgrG